MQRKRERRGRGKREREKAEFYRDSFIGIGSRRTF